VVIFQFFVPCETSFYTFLFLVQTSVAVPVSSVIYLKRSNLFFEHKWSAQGLVFAM
jgi:hypothetical protein